MVMEVDTGELGIGRGHNRQLGRTHRREGRPGGGRGHSSTPPHEAGLSMLSAESNLNAFIKTHPHRAPVVVYDRWGELSEAGQVLEGTASDSSLPKEGTGSVGRPSQVPYAPWMLCRESLHPSEAQMSS